MCMGEIESVATVHCRGSSWLVPLLGTSYRGIRKQHSQKRRTPVFHLDAVCKLASCRGDCLGGGRAALRWAWLQSGQYRGTFKRFAGWILNHPHRWAPHHPLDVMRVGIESNPSHSGVSKRIVLNPNVWMISSCLHVILRRSFDDYRKTGDVLVNLVNMRDAVLHSKEFLGLLNISNMGGPFRAKHILAPCRPG